MWPTIPFAFGVLQRLDDTSPRKLFCVCDESMLVLWVVAAYMVEFPIDPEKINGKVVQTWYAFKPQLSFVQRWRLMGASYSQSGDFRLGELSRVAFERNDSGGGLFARLTGAFGRRGLHSQLALITGNMDQMQSGVNFVDFKAQGQDGKSAAR